MIRTHRLIPSSPARLCALATALAWVLLLPSAPAFGTTGVVSVLGSARGGERAAQFKEPSGITVNQSTGNVYVADSQNNRVQEFAANGAFLRTWGYGVTASGPDNKPGVDEVKSVAMQATSGTFQLEFGGIEFFGYAVFGEFTESMPVGASAATVEAALQALPSVGGQGGVIAVTGAGTSASPYVLTFEGSLGGAKQVLGWVTSSESFPQPPFANAATTVTPGSSPFEECVAANGDTCGAGQASAEAGGMSEPLGVAVDQTTGNVYVTDEGNRRVDVYSATGEFEGAWGWGVSDGAEAFEFCTAPSEPNECRAGLTGSGAGEFGGTVGYPAVDPTSGDVYVADPAHGHIDDFSVTTSSGKVTSAEFVRSFGEFEGGSPVSVAVDDAGSVYALLGGYYSGVEKLDPAGLPMGLFATAQLSGEPGPTAVTVNPDSDRVLVLRPCNTTICPGAASTAERVFELNTNGELYNAYEPLVVDPGIREAKGDVGLAAASSGGNIYLAAAFYAQEGPQYLLTLNTLVPPAAAVAAASGVTSSEAVLHGTVTPNEDSWNQIRTEYQFEYSLDGKNWTPVSPTGTVAGSMAPVAVEQTVTGLESATVYHVRLHAFKEYGAGEATSASTAEFETESAPPTVPGASVSDIEARSAILQAQVNPQGEDTKYRFEYGPTEAYGSVLPSEEGDAGSNVGDVNVNVHPEGLAPGTLYHYRVLATNARGTGEATGTFTTHALTPPAVATGGYGALAQNSVTITGTLSTEGLPTTYGFEVGTSTSYGPATGLGFVGAGASEATVSLSLSGLQPGTTYHYRITASNVDGASYGADRTFTTTTFPNAFATPPAPLPFVTVPQTSFPDEPTTVVVKKKSKATKHKRHGRVRHRKHKKK